MWISGILAVAVGFSLPAGDEQSLSLKGYVGGRLDQMLAQHVRATDVDYITAPFVEKTERHGGWQTEFWGKYMQAAVPFLTLTHDAVLADNVCRGVDRILSTQEENGYIGNYPEELRCGEGWDVWGIKYTMMGLLHYYDWKLKAESEKCKVEADAALEAAKRLCDYMIAEIGPNGKRGRELWQTGNWSGCASSSVLEPVVWLYRRIRLRQDFGGQVAAKKYLDFATYIVKGMTEPKEGPRLVDLALEGISVADRNGYGNVPQSDGAYVMKHNRRKAYETMSCYQGLLEYVEVKSEELKVESEELKNLRKAAVMTAEDIVREEVTLAGGCSASEQWLHGARKQTFPYRSLQETCVTTTWMRFCQKLLDVTDDPRWADQIERSFYNAYLAALKPDGSVFAGYTPLAGSRSRGQHHCFMQTDCCTANGPRGFLCFLERLFVAKGNEVTFNFYATTRASNRLSDGRNVAFDMYTLYPRENTVRIVSHAEGAGCFDLRLRIPSWSARTTVKVNGTEINGIVAGRYLRVSRDWRFGDVIEIAFDMPVVVHEQAHHYAFTRGPVLLARDSRFEDGDIAEVFQRKFVDGSRVDGFSPVAVPSDDMWMAFAAVLPVGSHHENPEARLPSVVHFCDFASAGNEWRRTNNYRTWLPAELYCVE